MTFDADDFKRHIPYYLAEVDQKSLVAELKAFTVGKTPSYFLSDYYNVFKLDLLQEDGWQGFQLFLFDSGERRLVRGVVLSNSCDIDPTNKREVPGRVVFAQCCSF